ncbi:tudor domain-containing protein 5 isoform X4 [Narcine bancroftii]|uniref:tudor domain-containing protein 5 isoform X4 n=1 Tax=Narcine bancroftii TaxID=1343680 RepID=UPI00383188FF
MSGQEQLLEVLKKELRSLLISSKNGLTPSELEEDYQTMMGKRLPLCALGYKSVIELVSSIPDTIKVHSCANGSILLKGIGDETTKGIEELVAKAKVSSKTKRNFRKTRCKLVQIKAILPRRCNTTPVLPALVKCKLQDLLASFPCGVLLSDFDQSFLKKYGRPFQYTQYGFYSLQEVFKAISEDVMIQQTKQGSLLLLKNGKRGSLLKQDKPSIQTSQAKSNAITMQINPSISPTSKQSLPSLKLGNVQDSAPETADFDRDLKKLVEDLRTVLVDKGVEGTMDTKVKEKIQCVVAQRPEGLLASRLPMEYKNIFGVDLPFKELGFYSVTELVGALNDIFHVERDYVNQDWLIFDARNSNLLQKQKKTQFNKTNSSSFAGCNKPTVEESTDPEKNFDTETVSLKMLQETFYLPESEIPPDAIQDGTLYKLPEQGENFFTCVFIESVTSPSQFYVRFYGEWTSVMFEDLMIEMRRCYSYEEVSERYLMPDSFIRPGQVCCVRNREDVWWYRVIIHQVLDGNQVEVYYVDFGDISLVDRSRLRFLKCCYSKLPAQGIPSTLMWLQPVEDEWSTSAKSQFLRFCGKQPLVALICGYIDDVLHLFLCDTSTDEDIYINDVLKKAGHAVPCFTNNINKGFRQFNPISRYLKIMPFKMESTTMSLAKKPKSSIAERDHKNVTISSSGNNKQQELCSQSFNGVDYLQSSKVILKSQDIPDEIFKSEDVQPCVKTDSKKANDYICKTFPKESTQTTTGSLFNNVQKKSALISPVLPGQREFHLTLSSSSAALGPSARMAGALHNLTWLPVKNKR